MTKIQLICVDDKGCKDWLTFGKLYYAWDMYNEFKYKVINNKNFVSEYRKSRFMTPAEFRDMRINQILEDD